MSRFSRWRRSRGRVRWTRLGRGALWMALPLLGAAYNTGNNLLLLVLAALGVYLALSRPLARAGVRRLDASIGPIGDLFAGDEVPVRVEVRCRSRVAGAPQVSLAFTGGAEAGSAWVPWLPRRGSVRFTAPVRFPVRGVHELGLLARCAFPVGLAEGERAIVPPRPVLVFPALDPDYRPPLFGAGVLGEQPGQRPGWGVDLLDLREYRAGDDVRSIDWKATARRARAMVRITAREEEAGTVLVVDPTCDAPEVPGMRALVEKEISRAATAAVCYTDLRRRVRLLVPEGWREPAPGESELRLLLEGLARLRVSAPQLPEGWWWSRVRPGESVVVFRAASPSGGAVR